jgi:YebC/PmpR family DNA-binding regulatory protein
MSGHSKWATTKRAKAVVDAKRGATFTKLSNLITIAAREKGGDLDTNFTLRMAVEKAKAANMPKENIERAIKKGTGELAGGQLDELYYEGVGPANVQFIVKSLTDNKNRSAAQVRHLFTKAGGSLASVMWNFEKKGVIFIADEELKAKNINNEDLELELIEVGADDILLAEEGLTIYTAIGDLQIVKKFLDDKKINTESAEIEFVAKEQLALSDDDRAKVESFIDALDYSDEVADYYTNANV